MSKDPAPAPTLAASLLAACCFLLAACVCCLLIAACCLLPDFHQAQATNISAETYEFNYNKSTLHSDTTLSSEYRFSSTPTPAVPSTALLQRQIQHSFNNSRSKIKNRSRSFSFSKSRSRSRSDKQENSPAPPTAPPTLHPSTGLCQGPRAKNQGQKLARTASQQDLNFKKKLT